LHGAMWALFYNVQHVGARNARSRTANGRPLQPHHEFLLLYGTHRTARPTGWVVQIGGGTPGCASPTGGWEVCFEVVTNVTVFCGGYLS